MSQPAGDLPPVLSDQPAGFSREQAQQEEALHEVGATIPNIEQAIRRADKARKAISRGIAEANFLLALGQAIAEMEKTRRTLQQQTYFGRAQQRLL